uniref:SUN domain-containing protein n=1 Tax=Anopheles epiroticus TaxID=199890 RepID=A0A182P662_9DIPT
MVHLPSANLYMVVNLYLVAFCYIKWQLSMWLVGAIAERAGRMRKLTVLVTFCWVALISQIVAISNLYHDGLQDIPGPPSIITLVDNQHHELNNIESKLEDNLEATLKNLSHNNVHTVQTIVPLHDDDSQPLVGATDVEETQGNDTTAAAAVETEEEHANAKDSREPNEQPLLVMIPSKDPDEGSLPSGSPGPVQIVESPSAGQEATHEGTVADAATTAMPPKQLEVNLTEENPMPVFSEWAQKQMAEAEKKLGEVVNASAMKKGTKPAGSKAGGGSMKLRAKNYAAPECGAKIIASNPEAQSTGSVLTAPKDEYLLNPCTSKIWFVVELCEPVQAERIELANFELFSSSPKEFTVSVSNRFPTRDWANVGQFTAKDERDVQSFLLHPHLFGKFVRVEILSHYNQEHFCPVSLFRVYGTSEFEAFETDNTPLLPEDDDDDDELAGLSGGVSKEQGQVDKVKIVPGAETKLVEEHFSVHEKDAFEQLGPGAPGVRKVGKNPNNILKSASEVVMNMVKKAAEALGKSGNDSNDATAPGSTENGKPAERIIPMTDLPSSSPTSLSCVTLAYTIRCVNCTDHFRARLESLMNCKHNLLTSLLGVARIEQAFDSAQHFVCANVLGFNLPRSIKGESEETGEMAFPSVCLNMRYSVLNLLPDELVAGLCNMMAYDLNLIAKTQFNDDEKREIEGNAVGSGEASEQNTLDQHHVASVKNGQQQEEQTQDVENSVMNRNEKTHTSEQQEQSAVQEDTEKIRGDSRSDSFSDENASKEDVNMFATEPAPTVTPESVRDEASQNTESYKEQENQPHQQQQQEAREKVDFANNHHWETMDDGMLGNGGHHHQQHHTEMAGTTGPAAVAVTPGMATGQQKVQPESVFLRLSNRIKALERNMSLSGQYLEELSRRYRKQVEELQHSYAKTLHEIQEQNQRMADSEMKLREVNERLRQDLVDFQATATDWRNIALAVLAMIVLMLFMLLAMVRSVARSVNRLTNSGHTVDRQQQPAPLPQSVIDRELAQVGSDAKPIRGRMLRRKSIDGMPMGGSVDVTGSTVSSASGIIIATAEPPTVATSLSPGRLRKKRPSEEALNISGTYVNLLIDDGESTAQTAAPVVLERKKSKQKHRKVSAPSMMPGSSSTPMASYGGGVSSHEPAKRSVSMIEPRLNGGGGSFERQQSPDTQETSSRIDELPYLEDNDEFIIPTASDLSYDEYMPGSNASSTAEAGMMPNEMERKRNGAVPSDGNGSGPPLAGHGDAPDAAAELKTTVPKASRRLSWYRWWSSEQSKVLSSSSPSSSQEVASSPDGKQQQQQRQRIGKAKSASPSDGGSAKQQLLGDEPVKLSVSFNGDLPSNGIAASSGNGVLERKSSRGSIRKLFRKVF